MSLLRDRRSEFEAAGVAVLGISRDSPWSHVAWREVLDLDFPLVSDWNGEAVKAFGVADEWRGMRDVPVRSAFLVDRDGMIRGSWRYDAGEVPDMDELLEAARSL
jgi:peroxiredoxin